MEQTKQFSTKAQYVTPSCKSAIIRAKKSILAGSYGDPGEAGGQGEYIDDTGEDY